MDWGIGSERTKERWKLVASISASLAGKTCGLALVPAAVRCRDNGIIWGRNDRPVVEARILNQEKLKRD